MEFRGIRRKRGQAGIEFLATYGWAILVVMVSLVALIYFDVFNIGTTAPDKCILPTGLICLDSRISASEGITLSIANGMKRPLFNFTVGVSDCGTNEANATEGMLRDSETEIFTINCTETLYVGNLLNSDVNVTYQIGNNPAVRLTKTVTGVVSGTIEE